MSTAPAAASVRALLDRAEERARAGDATAALSFYQAALQTARGAPLDPASIERLRSAQAYVQQQANAFQQSLDGALAAFEPESEVAKTRLTHALDMLAGRRPIELQQPTVI
jgi:hypothetical protein